MDGDGSRVMEQRDHWAVSGLGGRIFCGSRMAGDCYEYFEGVFFC